MATPIQPYVERGKKRETVKQDALRAWNDYQADGRHLTLEEADAWLKRLAGEDREVPIRHR